MSILKKVVSEAIASTLRKSPVAGGPNRRAKAQAVGGNADQKTGHPTPTRASESGMKVVILNWKAGENDPFTIVNAAIRQHLRARGKNVEVIEIFEGNWPTRLAELAVGGVEFAITRQGLGSHAPVGDQGESLWDLLRIPLICIHADHPCHMPLNHQLDSRYCLHLYTNGEFARYSNHHFRRAHSASVIDIPQLFREPRLERRVGDYFVFAKNINDPVDTENFWRQQSEKRVFDAYMMAAETLQARIVSEPYVEIHEVLDDLIATHDMEWLSPAINPDGYHRYHSQLDHYVRSYKSIAAVTAVGEFPVRIYGRGWDRIAQRSAASHVFEAGRNMADSQSLYYTRFGLIDVSPAKLLHDRARRAMVNGSPFLSSANLEDTFADMGRFQQLFFSFRPDDLREKCAAVVVDPEGHRAVAQQFADAYDERFRVEDFVNRIDDLAKVARTS